jgi:Zn-dependent alcohol dehydrogenase
VTIARIQELTGGGVDFAFDAIGVAKTMERDPAGGASRRHRHCAMAAAVLVGVPRPPPASRCACSSAARSTAARREDEPPDRDFPMYVRWFRRASCHVACSSPAYTLDQINDACAALERGGIGVARL